MLLRREDPARFQSPDIFSHRINDASHGDIRGSANVGGRQYIVVKYRINRIRRFLPEYIQTRASDLLRGKGILQGAPVNQPASGKIDQKRIRLHHVKSMPSHHIPVFGSKRKTEDYIVGPAKKFVHIFWGSDPLQIKFRFNLLRIGAFDAY